MTVSWISVYFTKRSGISVLPMGPTESNAPMDLAHVIRVASPDVLIDALREACRISARAWERRPNERSQFLDERDLAFKLGYPSRKSFMEDSVLVGIGQYSGRTLVTALLAKGASFRGVGLRVEEERTLNITELARTVVELAEQAQRFRGKQPIARDRKARAKPQTGASKPHKGATGRKTQVTRTRGAG